MSEPWNHGKISRQDAEELLAGNPIDGAFLVRESESVAGAHVLSLWHGEMIHHFRVHKQDNKFTVQSTPGAPQTYFSSLTEIIELFKQPGQGLTCQLKEPIIKESEAMESDEEDKDVDHEEERGSDVVDGDSQYVDFSRSIPLIQKMSKMDMSGIDNEFSRELQSYLNNGFSLDPTKQGTSDAMTGLQEFIAGLGEGLGRGLKDFLRKISFMQELFSPENDVGKRAWITCTTDSNSSRTQTNAFDELVDDFAKCLAGVKSLQTLVEVQKSYQENDTRHSQTRTFEVNTCGNFKTKAYIKVDIAKGKLWFMKNECDLMEDSYIVSHDRILQLVKDPEIPKLTFKIDNKSNREYIFKDIQARENLGQLVHYMKKHYAPVGGEEEQKEISVFVGTWNMGSASPSNIESWVRCCGLGEVIKDQCVGVAGHDIYAFGTQESSIGESAWITRLKAALKALFKNTNYYTVALYSLWGIRLVILAKDDHKHRISHVEKSCVKTGIANKLGNKGGVGISFDFLSTSLCFINTHLTSGNEALRKARRKKNYIDILKGLNLGHKNAYDLTNQFHHVFWFGDLNYRIDLDVGDILSAIESKDYKKLIAEDQLTAEKTTGNAFFGFDEQDINFPPTYRYKRGARTEYEHRKVKRSGVRINVPSWCDRILRKSFPEIHVKQISYGCTEDIVTSDHSPVFASFELPITSQFVTSQDQTTIQSQTKNSSYGIIIEFIKAKVATRSKPNFYLEFHSDCLTGIERSSAGKNTAPCAPRNVNSNPNINCFTEWNSDLIPKLTPIREDNDYLKEQHLMIAVKSESGDESYGECVLSLKPHLFLSPQTFKTDLTHGGIKTGEIEGTMYISAPEKIKQVKPVIHGQLESNFRKHSSANPASMHRPISCVTPNVGDNDIPKNSKSFSLGRQPLRKDIYSGLSPRDDAHSEYMCIEYPMKTNKYIALNEASSETVPPPRPVKRSQLPTFPKTVEEFLMKLGLNQYLSCLKENGFEQMVFLEEISDRDLADTGITNVKHRNQILKEVSHLRQSGCFSQS